jgi:hypothetical protein
MNFKQEDDEEDIHVTNVLKKFSQLEEEDEFEEPII